MENKEIITPKLGMDFSNPSTLKNNSYSLMVNGSIESVNGDVFFLSNEASNLLCSRLKGYKVVGTSIIPSLNLTFLFLVDPLTNNSEIGFIYEQHNEDKKDLTTNCSTCNSPIIEDIPLEQQIQYEKCLYYTFVNARCLNFSIDHPVKSWIKVDDCNIRIYFTDRYNPPRYIDYTNFQKIDISNCPLIETNELDCDKIKVFPATCYPQVEFIDVVAGGQNQAGTYQFIICYADVRSNKVTDYFYATDPIPLFDQPITIATDYPIAKSIKLQINNLNTDFKYINLVVLKTINGITTPYLVETIAVSSSFFTYLYTGIDANIIDRLSIDEILQKKPIYTSANGIAESNGYLFLDQLEEQRILNLQPSLLDLPLYWQTVELTDGDYKKPLIAGNYVGYLGDEVYAFGIAFTRKNAHQTAIFTIPGRKASNDDYKIINNSDVIDISTCSTRPRNQNWQVYNTAIDLGYSGSFTNTPITQFTTQDCLSIEFEIVVDSLGNNIYYIKGTDIVIPDITAYCDDCRAAITAQYTGIDGVTLLNVTYNSPNLDLYSPSSSLTVVNPSGQTTIPCYSYNDKNLGDPPLYPYSNNPCDGSLGTDPPSFLDTKTNITCDFAIQISQAPDATCLPDTGNTYGSFLPNPSGVNCSVNSGSFNDKNQSWYKFVATQTVAAISIYTANNPVIEVFNSCPAPVANPSGCPTITPDQRVALITSDSGCCSPNSSQYYSTNHYTVLNNLTLGQTYYIKVYSQTGDTTPPNMNKYCYFRICLTTPPKCGETTQDVRAIATLTCSFLIEYETTRSVSDGCNIPNYKYGLMSYWESTELYPCNEELFGPLANKPIRHHKFPDNLVSPFYIAQSNVTIGFNKKIDDIYPKGIFISVKDIKNALYQAELSGLISEEERNSICGYRIYRGDRRGNEAIIGKGLLYDVWKYKDNVYNTQNNFLFSNFPFNDNTDNRYISTRPVKGLHDLEPQYYLMHPYKNEEYKNNKYVFEAPNLSFNNPGIGSNLELKLECEQFGWSQGSYQDIKNNAEYQYIGAGIIAAAIGFASVEAAFEALSTMAQATLTLAIQVFGSGSDLPLGLILALVGENILSPVRLFSFYGQYYDLIQKFAPYRNYASFYSSIGLYDDMAQVANAGFKRRLILNSEYLKSGILNVRTGTPQIPNYTKFNNYKRESSVFLEIDDFFPKTSKTDDSRYIPDTAAEWALTNPRNIASYYASVKNELLNQYGNLDSINWLDTGYNGIIDWNNPNQDTASHTIFGGDTFINRFTKKRKIPFFLEDRVQPNGVIDNIQDNADIILSELPNVGYPRYFMNYPTGLDYNVGAAAVFGQVAILNNNRADYNLSNFSTSGKAWADGGLAAAILGSTAAASFGVISLPITVAIIEIAVKRDLGNDIYLNGKYFHSCYGITSFLCESNYNLDYRHGQNNKEKDFYPHVADTIQWTQESFVPIEEDNFYFYNKDYSKANKENPGYILNNDYNRIKEDCKSSHPNRVIYSLQDNDQNDRFDGNLIFLGNNYYDFPKSAGKVKVVKGIENNKVLVLQENQATVYNSYVTLQTNLGTSTVGNNTLFSQQPAQFIKTDLGYGGSQTSTLISTEYGHFWVDNKRGLVMNFSQGINNIIKPEDAWWFKEFLPFKILRDFPDVDIDNNFKYFGMTMVYDARYKRVFITKRDSQLREEYKHQMTYYGKNFIFQGMVIEPTNNKYFCNKSWTIAYSPITKSFLSFYSFTPNYYIGNQNYFQSGLNYETLDYTGLGLYSHLLTDSSYQFFGNKLYPFIVEFAQQSKAKNGVLQYIEYTSQFYRSDTNLSFAPINDKTYTKAYAVTQNQSTGIIDLVVKEKDNLYQMMNLNFNEALVESINNTWSFNNLSDLSLTNGNSLMVYNCGKAYKEINPNSISYTQRYPTNLLRSDYFQVGLINDKWSNYKITHRFSYINTNYDEGK